MCHIAAAIRPTGSALRRASGRGSGPDSADVRGRSGSVVRFCRGVRSCGGCSFGGGDVSVHRCRGFDPSVGGRRAMRCGRRWPSTTRCCARRSRRTAGSCSSTPATVCARRSRRPRSAVDAAVAAQRELELPVRMGIATGEAELRDGGLLRCGAQSCRAGDGRRAWWSDPVGRVDGGSAQRSGSAGSGAATVAGSADPGRGVSGPSSGSAHGVSAVAGAGCESGKPAACDHQLHRARVRGRRGASGGQGASVGDVDRGGRGRQDPPGIGGRGAAGR